MSSSQDAALIQFLMESVPDYAVILLDLDGTVLTWNRGAELIKGYRSDEIIGRKFTLFYPPADLESGRPFKLLDAALRHGRHEETGTRLRKDGTPFQAQVLIMPRFDDAGRHIGFGKLTRDVTAQVQAAENERRLHQFVDVIRDTMIDGLIVIDPEGTIRVFNPAAERIFGYSAAEAIGQNLKMLMPEPDRSAHDQHLQRYSATGKRSVIGSAREVTGQRKDGTTLPISIAVGEAKFVDETIFVGVVHDLTAQKTAEGHLRQAQRLDAIGKLTGGLAHDFNNILMVLLSNIEALMEDVEEDPGIRRRLDRMVVATERAASLTRQLLAFARKQPLQPLSTDLNAVVTSTSELLGRTLGEHVEISWMPAAGLWPTDIDRTQLESALLNLCINARDAMPSGGRLVIETQNVTLDDDYARHNAEVVPGEYVMLAVSDTGQGIAADVLDHVFEPFFSTKGLGNGTGLGLSMVYGFVRQSSDHIKIYSEVGSGTTVRIYLPRGREVPASAVQQPGDTPVRGTERILVVEDDPVVRDSVVAQLASLGYATTQASNGTEGLERLGDSGPFDLLLTDVVMPGEINGRILADEARRRVPGLRVLFMSGYTENAIVHHGRLDADAQLLAKPFRKVDLARAIRRALGDSDPG